jgi:predicted adenine nucleotide alpha hydrolase (AANH) superfamily ATPase
MENSKIVLLSCCAPCSAAAIKRLKSEGADFVVLFYNPNIFPRAEYDKRLAEQIKLCEKLGAKYAVGDWNHDRWLSCVRGLETEPERGKRCAECFRMRLAFGADWARKNGYDKIASVFGASKHKDQNQVDEAARDIDIYVPTKFDFAPEPDTYRQKYCGCEFSENYHD